MALRLMEVEPDDYIFAIVIKSGFNQRCAPRSLTSECHFQPSMRDSMLRRKSSFQSNRPISRKIYGIHIPFRRKGHMARVNGGS